MIHVGLLGCGNISGTHARAVRATAGAELVAVCGTKAETARAFCDVHGGVPYHELQRFLSARPMDLVIIGTPSGLHAEHGMAAVGQGLDVLVEKPIDVVVERAEALVAAADRAGVTLGVVFQDRLKPEIQRLKRFIDGGGLGRPTLASARVKWYRPPQYYRESRWRGTRALDGGALMNQAIHTVDLLAWLLGPVKSVCGRIATRVHAIESEDTAVAVLEFANGALATLEAATSVFPGYPRRLEVTGESGTVVLEGDRVAAVDLRDSAGSPALAASPSDGGDERAQSAAVRDTRGHQAVLEDFIAAIGTRGGARRPPSCDGREGLRSLALVQAIYESARTGRPVAPSPGRGT